MRLSMIPSLWPIDTAVISVASAWSAPRIREVAIADVAEKTALSVLSSVHPIAWLSDLWFTPGISGYERPTVVLFWVEYSM
jgi:hypothetical protein